MSDGTVALQWSGVAEATEYRVYRAGQQIGSAAQAAFVDLAPIPAAIYTVTAVVNGEESGPSMPATATTVCAGTSNLFPYVVVNPNQCQEDVMRFIRGGR